MSEYISREAALELLKEAEYMESSLNVAGSMICAIRDLPAADVAPVVRCRECAHCDSTTPYELWCLGRGWPNQMVPPDGFCDRGKRRPDA